MQPLGTVAAKWLQLQPQQDLLDRLLAQELDERQAWSRLCVELLHPEMPFELHKELFAAVYASWQVVERGPAPVWVPDPQVVLSTNAARFMAHFQGDLQWEALRSGDPCKDWPLLQQVSCDNPEVFWAAAIKALGVRLAAPPRRVLDDDTTNPDSARWLPGARLNIAACALQCPKVTNHQSPAIIWAAEGCPTQLQHVSWGQLQERCMHVAACVAVKYQPGDALAIAMPLTVEAAVIYLGVVLAGCVVVSIADSFAAEEVATRLHIAGAKAIFTQDVVLRGGKVLPLYSRVVDGPSAPTAIVVSAASGDASGQQVQLRLGDVHWGDFMATQAPTAAGSVWNTFSRGGQLGLRPLPHVVDAESHSNILFSSGTTGEPKAIPWSHTTPLRCAVDGWALQDIQPGSVVAWPTNLGWMMGPWLLYASLLNGGTVAIYEGSPLGRDFGEFVVAARVNVLGLVPSIVKAWRRSNCMAGLDWQALQCFSSTGEASSPDDYHWLASRVKGYRPVIEYCGGTEVGGGFLAGCRLQPQAPSTFSTPTLGASLVLLPQAGGQCPHNMAAGPAIGELALVPPMLGLSQQLLNRDHTAAYYQGMPRCTATGRLLRRHGDEVQRLPGGYYRALGRCDDTMNLGGIKVSSVELERVVLQHVPGIGEVAAVGVPAEGGGPELLNLFVVLGHQQAGTLDSGSSSGGPEVVKQLQRACQVAVRAHLNPLFKVERLLLVASLPRTASNKVMRRVLRDQVLQPHARL